MSSPNALRSQVGLLVEGLNPEQKAAVLHRGGPVLVLAGAGTGKTRVITVRIAHLVAFDGLSPESILALTFTNKAAGEMSERVGQILGRSAAAAMTIGTFHSLGLEILERHARLLGYRRGLSLLDAADQVQALRQVLKMLKIDPRRHDPRRFLMAISVARNANMSPEDMAAMPGRKITARIYQKYLDWLGAYQAMDFDDLILKTNQLFREHPEVLARWRGRFQTILVDEYQDTNLAQLELVQHLADVHRQLCVVGDDDQSIYGWRGADIRNILEFEKYFPDTTALALTQNYRSTGHILAAANAVIGNNSARRVKNLWTSGGEGEKIEVVECKDPRQEARFLASEITHLHTREGVAYKDIGVLFRAKSQTRYLEDAFRLGGIPYRVVGAYEFFERKEIKDILSYLRLAQNPHDDTAFLRVVNFPQRGLGPKAIEALHVYAAERGLSLFGAAREAGEVQGLDGRQVKALTQWVAFLREAEGRHLERVPLGEMVQWMIDALNAKEAWIRAPSEGPGGAARWRNVEGLMRLIRSWQEKNPEAGIHEWLRVVALDARGLGEEEERDEVALLTVHASKGLEWPVVFVVGCQEGLMPHQRTLDSPRGDVSEERRLFYVAITRARERCLLTYSQVKLSINGQEKVRPSRFLREIPDKHLAREAGRAEGRRLSREEVRARLEALRARLAAGN